MNLPIHLENMYDPRLSLNLLNNSTTYNQYILLSVYIKYNNALSYIIKY